MSLVKDEKTEKVTFNSLDELKNALRTDKALGAELIADEKAFYEKYLAKAESASADPKKPEPPVKQPDDEEITVKVRKSTLGSYAKNRTPEEAVVELARGKSESDKTIDFLKNHKLPGVEEENINLRAQTLTLKQELEAYKKKKDAAPAAKPVEVALPADLENLDLLDPDAQKKVMDTLKQFSAALKSTQEQNQALKSELDGLKTDVTSANERTNARETEESLRNKVASDLSEIDTIRRQNPDLFVSQRPYEAIQGDYVAFVDDLCLIAGVKGPVRDDKGEFTPEARAAYALYHDAEKGKELKEKCDKEGVALPEDFADMMRMHEIRTQKVRIINSATGRIEEHPLPLEDAVKQYKKQNELSPDKARLEGVKKGHDAYNKAVEKRAQFAKEIRASQGASPVDLSAVTAAEVRDMFLVYDNSVKKRKPDQTTKQKLEHILRNVNPPWSEADIAARLGG